MLGSDTHNEIIMLCGCKTSSICYLSPHSAQWIGDSLSLSLSIYIYRFGQRVHLGFCKMLWKNPNEIFCQPNIYILCVCVCVFLYSFPHQWCFTHTLRSYSQVSHNREISSIPILEKLVFLAWVWYITFSLDLICSHIPTNFLMKFQSSDCSHHNLPTPRLCLLPERLKRCRAMLSIKCIFGWRKKWFSNISMLDIQLIFPAMIGISKGMYHCKIFTNIYQNHSAISETKRIVIYPHLPPSTNRMSWPWVNYVV